MRRRIPREKRCFCVMRGGTSSVEAAHDVEWVSGNTVDGADSLAIFVVQVEVALDRRFLAQNSAALTTAVHRLPQRSFATDRYPSLS